MRLQGAPLHDAVAEGWDLRAAATVCEVEFAEILCMRGGQCNKAQRPSCASIRTSTLIGPLVRDLIRDDPRRGIRVMQVHAAAPCQH